VDDCSYRGDRMLRERGEIGLRRSANGRRQKSLVGHYFVRRTVVEHVCVANGASRWRGP